MRLAQEIFLFRRSSVDAKLRDSCWERSYFPSIERPSREPSTLSFATENLCRPYCSLMTLFDPNKRANACDKANRHIHMWRQSPRPPETFRAQKCVVDD